MKDWRSRNVRFKTATVLPDGNVCVELERPGAGTYVGMGESTEPGLEVFRAGADAAAQAVAHAADSPDASVEVKDLEVVRAVGETLVVVAVSARLKSESHVLIGVCVVRDDPAHAAARAVLNATNRAFNLA
jgi:hypothetical protein